MINSENKEANSSPWEWIREELTPEKVTTTTFSATGGAGVGALVGATMGGIAFPVAGAVVGAAIAGWLGSGFRRSHESQSGGKDNGTAKESEENPANNK